MNKNIEHYLFHKENFLDEKYCENCINELNKCVWEKHEWYGSRADAGVAVSGDNEPEVFYMGKYANNIQKINEFIIVNLESIILEYIRRCKVYCFAEIEGYTPIKFLRYHPGQTMDNHWDHIQSLFDGERRGIPTLSIIGILNDDYEGGELIMFEDKKIDTKKGDLLIFPSNFLYPHEVAPVTKGVRYSYVSWVW